MSALHLFRHAQAGPRHKYDQLSELGKVQARKLGEHLASQPVEFSAVFTGGLARQQATAEAVAQVYRERGLPFPEIQLDPNWDEFDLGDVYRVLAEPLGRDDEQFFRQYSEMVRLMEDEAHSVHRNHNYCDIAVIRAWVAQRYPYEGESWQSFRARITSPFDALTQFASGEQIAVFTSATPISIWVGRSLGLDDSNIWRIAGVAYNTGISTFRISQDDCRLFTFNGIPHLTDPLWRTFR